MTTTPLRLAILGLLALVLPVSAAEPPKPVDDFPRFLVPGKEAEMARLQELFRLHYGGAFSNCALWDAWLPLSTLWPATGEKPTAERFLSRYRDAFLNRRIDPEGYVSMQQHRGLAHSEGWPFPTYQQAGGVGWFFSVRNESYGVGLYNMKPLTNIDGWEVEGAEVESFSPERGLTLRATADVVTITTPPFARSALIAPFIRLEWGAKGLGEGASPSLSWLWGGETEWSPNRRADFPALSEADGLQYANIPLYKQAGYDEAKTLTQLRFTFDKAAGSALSLKSLITAIDTRHPITNLNLIRGSADYFAWTTDVEFLKANIDRLRRSIQFALDEFGVRENHLIRVPWVGHEGTTGLAFDANGKKTLLAGRGVGNNYWDLLPFGGDDGLATVYLYDALGKLAMIEQSIAEHPEWGIPEAAEDLRPDALRTLAEQVKQRFNETFWSEETGRFVGWRDQDGRPYDYGFVFVNTEAIAYGIAADDHARSVYDWLDGRRVVAGDTSQGADIYHWRFGPRSTTKRNVETYVWSWAAPESLPWGGQVQDGGGVLGFTYFDVMARLQTLGPDDAWRRLREVIDWFGEVQSEGGYRAYYAKPGRGTLQGGGTAGGLGFDHEFMESVLVPQVMLYGFLGVEPLPGGLRVAPRLPSDWPSLTITRVQAQGQVFDITALPDEIRLTVLDGDGSDFSVRLPEGRWTQTTEGPDEATTPVKDSHARIKPRTGETHRFQRAED